MYELLLERTAVWYIKRVIKEERSDVYRDIGRNKGTVHGRVTKGKGGGANLNGNGKGSLRGKSGACENKEH